MLIKPLDEYKQYDVFLGQGWENWVRVKFDRARVEVIKTSVDDLDGSTIRLIYFKLKKIIEREKANSASSS